MTTNPESLVGSPVHFIGPIAIPVSTSLWATAQLMNYGDTLTITDEIVEAGFDRRRAHWLELLDDAEGQVERYGEVKFSRGSFPDYLPKKDPFHVALEDLLTEKYFSPSSVINTAAPFEDNFTVGTSAPGKDAA